MELGEISTKAVENSFTRIAELLSNRAMAVGTDELTLCLCFRCTFVGVLMNLSTKWGDWFLGTGPMGALFGMAWNSGKLQNLGDYNY
jgi:hypothetical protein